MEQKEFEELFLSLTSADICRLLSDNPIPPLNRIELALSIVFRKSRSPGEIKALEEEHCLKEHIPDKSATHEILRVRKPLRL